MDDILSFVIEAQERGLLTDPAPRPPEVAKFILPRRGKKAARAKRERVRP